ncbi:Interleukin-17 [Mactra antiquata]
MGLFTEGKAVLEDGCGKISPDKQDEMLRTLSTVHWTYFLLTSLKSQSEESLPQIKPPPSKTTFLHGNYGRKCPARNSYDNMEDCPVYYVLDHDKNRIPDNIVRAKCSCKACRHERSQYFTMNTCEPVYTYTPVWRRNTTDCEFRQILEYVPVSCTCRSKQIYL